MSLQVTPVSKCLDKKLLLFGLEMADLFIIFITLSVLNLIFGQSDYKVFIVWPPPVILGLILKFGKKGKPENYLIHWLRYQFSPGVYSAFKEQSIDKIPPKISTKDKT